jgi:peptide/nickel transport system substrate-binding protein
MRRESFVSVLLLIVASAVTATGMAEEDERPESIVVGQTVEPAVLDPRAATSIDEFRIIGNVFDGLVRFADASLSIEPALATAWEISEDGRTYTFELRREVLFHDGTPFNAHAVKFSLDRLLDLSSRHREEDSVPTAFSFDGITGTRVLDEYTVQIILDEPFAPLLAGLAHPSAMIVSPSAVENGDLDFGRNPVGTGPFRFVEWGERTGVLLAAVDEYWGERARVEEIVFRSNFDSNDRIMELLAGSVDILVEVPPDSVQVFAQRDDFVVYQEAAPHVWAVILNLREGPFTERALRLAANYAIDKEALVSNVLMGTATVAAGPISPVFDWAYHEELSPYPFDPVRAEELIAESGYRGEELVFAISTGGAGMLDPVQMGRAIRADLESVGLNVSIETYPWNTHRSRMGAGLEGRADLAQMAWVTTDPDTLPYLALRSAAWPENGGLNAGYYANARVDELLRQARSTPDGGERAALYHEVQEIVHDDAPWIFVAHGTQTVVASTRIRNLRLQPSYLLPLEGVTVD